MNKLALFFILEMLKKIKKLFLIVPEKVNRVRLLFSFSFYSISCIHFVNLFIYKLLHFNLKLEYFSWWQWIKIIKISNISLWNWFFFFKIHYTWIFPIFSMFFEFLQFFIACVISHVLHIIYKLRLRKWILLFVSLFNLPW